MKPNGIGSHHSHKALSDDWITPPEIIKCLGPFDFDPCPSSIQAPGFLGMDCYEYGTNALAEFWDPSKRIWLNPPYGDGIALWLEKASQHRNCIALIFARTETKAFCEYVWNRADGILFIKGRLTFRRPDGIKPKGNSGAPSVLVAYGENNVESLRNCGLSGYLVSDWKKI